MNRTGIQFVLLLLFACVYGIAQAGADTTGNSNNPPRSTGFFRSSLDALSNKRYREDDARRQVESASRLYGPEAKPRYASPSAVQIDEPGRRVETEKAEYAHRAATAAAEDAEYAHRVAAEKVEYVRRAEAEKVEFARRSAAEKVEFARGAATAAAEKAKYARGAATAAAEKVKYARGAATEKTGYVRQ